MSHGQKNIKWWVFLLAGSLIVKLSYYIYGRKRKQKLITILKNNFGQFAKKEEKEMKKLETGDETIAKYFQHAANIFKDYFIPNQGNDHKPKILHSRSLLVIVIALMAVKFSLTGYLFFIYPNQAKMESQMTSEILTLINNERQKNNLKPLALNAILNASALLKGDNMLMLDYFDHYGPDGKKPWDWIDRDEYKYLFVGENLAMNFYTAKAAHDALMASPSHKKNILNDKYEEIGLAVVTGKIDGENTNILVEMFASRQKPSLVLASADNKTAGTTKVQTAAAKPKTQALPTSDQTAQKAPATNLPVEKNSGLKPQIAAGTVAGTSTVIAVVESASSSIAALDSAAEKKSALNISTSTVAFLENKLSETSAAEEHLVFLAELAAKDSKILSPNPELDLGANNQIKYISPNAEDSGLAANLIKWSKYIYVSFLILLILALMVNIFVRITIQHKPVIIEAIIVIIFISSLITIKLHFLEYIVDKIAII